jgi:hypothetical protein
MSAQLPNLHLAVSASQINTLLRIVTALGGQVVDAMSNADAAALARALAQRSRRAAVAWQPASTPLRSPASAKATPSCWRAPR